LSAGLYIDGETVEIILDKQNRIYLVINDRDGFGENHKTELHLTVEMAIDLNKQLSSAIDKAVKSGFGFDV
jgi:hypothetical protein